MVKEIGLPKSIPLAAKAARSDQDLQEIVNESHKNDWVGSVARKPREVLVVGTREDPVVTEKYFDLAIEFPSNKQGNSTTAMVETIEDLSRDKEASPIEDQSTLEGLTAVVKLQQSMDKSNESPVQLHISTEAPSMGTNASDESIGATDSEGVGELDLNSTRAKETALMDVSMEEDTSSNDFAGLSDRRENETELEDEDFTETIEYLKEGEAKWAEEAKEEDNSEVASDPADSTENVLLDENKSSGKERVESWQSTSKVAPEVAVDEVVVVYRLQGESLAEPLSTLIDLGYTKEDVLLLQSDAVDLIVADKTARPKSGLPRKWQKVASRASNMLPPEEADDVGITTLSTFEALQERREGQESAAKKEKEVEATNRQQSSVTEAKGQTLKSEGDDERQQKGVVENIAAPPPSAKEEKKALAKVEAGPELEAMANGEKENTIDSDGKGGNQSQKDEVALYFDPIINKMRVTPLKNLKQLGYTKEEILELRPDRVAQIASERRPRQQNEIPLHWCNSKDEKDSERSEMVEVVLRSDVEGFMKAQGRAREARSEGRQPTRGDRARSREKSAFRADGRKKVMYNGRPRFDSVPSRIRLPDPPLLKVPRFKWMGLDTFRDLLRSEAEMRLRITGDLGGADFAESIKKECDMRLGLYEGLLRTVDKGIGKPLVPSRSQRGVVSPRNRIEQDRGGRRR